MRRQAPDTTIGPDPPDASGSVAPLLPPRPNLGPEPWREPVGVSPWLVAAGVLVVLLGTIVVRLRSRRRRRRSASVRTPSISGAARQDGTQTPLALLVARAEAIRSALVLGFGPGWAARTTEEIAEAVELAARIGTDRAARVVALLAEADRAKFAGEMAPGAQEEGEEVDRWVSEVVDALVPDGETSTSSAK